MPSIFNLKGNLGNDPLDNLKAFPSLILTSILNLILIIIIIAAVHGNVSCVLSPGIISIFIVTLILTSLSNQLRKSSSVIVSLLFFIPFLWIGLYTDSNNQVENIFSWKIFLEPSMLSFINTGIYKIVLTSLVYSLLLGVFNLFLARLLALLFVGTPRQLKPTPEQYKDLFRPEWSGEEVEIPQRDLGFWLLKTLGMLYLIFLILLLFGIFGTSPWPPQIRQLLDMIYSNPALAINTYFKMSLMVMLTFIGAYNKSLRFHTCLALIIGHLASSLYALCFYIIPFLHASEPVFLLESALVDGTMILVFLWVLLKYKKDAKVFFPDNDVPIDFSVPMTLLKWLYSGLGAFFACIALFILLSRIFWYDYSGIGVVFGSPDPTIGNTITLYTTLSIVSFLLVRRERLRSNLFNALLFPMFTSGILALLWLLIGDLNKGAFLQFHGVKDLRADWYFVLHALLGGIITICMIWFRKMYYKVDCAVNTLSPAAAINIIALENAFFQGDDKQQSFVMKSIDEYAGGISGRKRGLMNLPFGLLENFLNFVYGIHPPFSSMSREEQRYFLRKYFFRNEQERNQAIIPILANFSYQIGTTLGSAIGFAHYSYLNIQNKIGFVPVDARDRLQGDCASYDPPHQNIAPLPTDEKDPNNFKVNNPCIDGPLIAPRVTTPVKEATIPDEIDYIIIGSGAGGATAAYRLACTVSDPSQILLVESGNRYQPLQDFQDSEIAMMKKIFKEGGLQQTKKSTMTIMQGECLGGSTVVNNAVCFKMPDIVKQSWQNDFGIDLTHIDQQYQQVASELSIKPLGSKGVNQIVARKFEDAVAKYNATLSEESQLSKHDPVLANNLNNNGDGNWNIGNKRMRKRSMLETYIPWSEARGVKIISNITAVRFMEGKTRKAESVLLRTNNGLLTRVRVKKAVIVAGGTISSSHFLMRSEISNKYVGQRLSCNFAFPVTLDFDDELKAYDGDQITLGALDPGNRSAFETYFSPPASYVLSSVPFFFNRRDSFMDRYKNLVIFGGLLGSEPNGIVQKNADLLNGQAFTWAFGPTDRTNIKYSLTTLIQLGKLAGAHRAIVPTTPGIELQLDDKNIAEFTRSFNSYPLRMTDLSMGTAHPQGGNLMAGFNSAYKDQRVLNENFQVIGYDNVFVVDASLFPTSLTVNPQWTIMAMSSTAIQKVLTLVS